MKNNNSIKILVLIINKLKLRCRVQTKFDSEVSEWSEWVKSPSEGYIEPGATGPLSQSDLVYIEIETILKTKLGRLLPPKREDLKAELIRELTEASILFEDLGSLIRICA